MFKICLFLLLWLSLPALAERPEVEKLVNNQSFETRLGSALSPLTEQGFSPKLASIRRHVAGELGWVVPGTLFTPAASLPPNEYQILFRGQVVGQGKVEPGQLLAIGPESKLIQLSGVLIQDPTYGMPGKWVPQADKAKAEKLGCLVFDPVSVWATHLTELIRAHAAEYYSSDDLTAALAILQPEQPALVHRFHSDPATFQRLLAVVRNLLTERVCVRDLGTIGEVVIHSPHQDPDRLSEAARVKLAGLILDDLANEKKIQVVRVGARLEAAVVKLGSYTAQGLTISESPDINDQILPAINTAVERMTEKGLQPVLVTTAAARLILRRVTLKEYPNLVVLSRNELTPYYSVESAGVIELK
ncbi:MAG: FHIPEP family type III secretion protein [Candidatus Eremiobacteraeota bacterium]|nr:FHIPEP family type III secretion protein [Candidatus Eremiobacteraeota bacterium]MCW5869357.1 FHIPEP family type III secretion protein [Candidatus Eremiobacteraeota bacterium]